MAQRSSAEERVLEAWARAQAGWRGEPAEVFHSEYISRLQESARQLERVCAQLEEQTHEMTQTISMIENRLDN